jgi:hypothetical protein
MGRWTIKPSVRATLLGMLILVFLILVLPDVDLPDAAFHGGTAPVMLHARAVTPPSLLTVTGFAQITSPARISANLSTGSISPTPLSIDSIPILYRSLRC